MAEVVILDSVLFRASLENWESDGINVEPFNG